MKIEGTGLTHTFYLLRVMWGMGDNGVCVMNFRLSLVSLALPVERHFPLYVTWGRVCGEALIGEAGNENPDTFVSSAGVSGVSGVSSVLR